MVFPDKHFYVIGSGFGIGRKGHMGSYGFGIGLDPEYAKIFYEKEMPQNQLDRFNGLGKNLVKNIFDLKNNSMIIPPYHFLRNENENPTLLLQWCEVIGNACDLGIDGIDLSGIKRWDEYTMSQLIEYNPHNVDTLQQASGLLTIWNEWATSAYSLTKED